MSKGAPMEPFRTFASVAVPIDIANCDTDQIIPARFLRKASDDPDYARFLLHDLRFNSDGGEVNQCGNGARCFAKFVYEKKLTNKTEIVVETRSGLIKPKLENDGEVSVDMGVPLFSPKDIPLNVDQQQNTYRLTLNDRDMEFGSVSMGNPHAIFFTANLNPLKHCKLKVKLNINMENKIC